MARLERPLLDRPALGQDRAVDRPRLGLGERGEEVARVGRAGAGARPPGRRRGPGRPAVSVGVRLGGRSVGGSFGSVDGSPSADRTATPPGSRDRPTPIASPGDAGPSRRHASNRCRRRGSRAARRRAPSDPPRALHPGRRQTGNSLGLRARITDRSLDRGPEPVNARPASSRPAAGRDRARPGEPVDRPGAPSRRTKPGSTPNTSRIRSSLRTSAGRPVGDDRAAREEHEPREEVAGQPEVVEDGEDRRPVAPVEVDQEVHRLDLVAEVEVDGRLVEDEQRRGLGHGHREQDELAFAERQLAGVAAEQPADADPVDRGRDRRPVAGPVAAERVLVGQPARARRPPRPGRRTAARRPAGRPPAAGRSPSGRAARSGRRPARHRAGARVGASR